MPKRNFYVCPFCGDNVTAEFAVDFNTKHWHPECVQLWNERKELYDTISRVLGLKAPGPTNIKLVKQYFEEGYTYKGMMYTLIYLYDIKHTDARRAKERIGLIPYCYDEAQEYFHTKQKRINEVGANAEGFQFQQETNKVQIEKIGNREMVKEIKFINPFEGGING